MMIRKPFAFATILSCTILLLTGCIGQAEQTQRTLASGSYKITKQAYSAKDIMIHYPEIIGMEDKSKQETINNLIKTEALHQLSDYSEEELANLSLDLSCEIKLQKPEILSIAYSGLLSMKGAAHPSHVFFTTNIDMRDGSRLRIKDLVNLDSGFTEKVQNGRYFPAVAEMPMQELKEIVAENMLVGLRTADWPGYPQNEYGAYTYFTSGALGVSVGVYHAYGDHIEIEVPYEDIIDYINKKHAVWKAFY